MICKKILCRKALPASLALILSVNLCCPPAVRAASENTPKEEVVYVNLNSDGTISEIYVVNSFDLETPGQILDYGEYTEVRNMTSQALIDQNGDAITIDAQAGKLYYEGVLADGAIPWDFEFHYYLDGQEYPAGELAGKSGALEVTASVRENKNCGGSFFEDYALQVTFTLDTEQAKNISAENATIANVGSDKQLTYTILPGTETDLSFSADVTDFEMSAISLNGVRLNMDVEVDDEELMDQITELLDAIEELDEGSEELKDGAESLDSGAGELQPGVGSLDSGAGELQAGAGELVSGGSSLASGAETLSEGASSLDQGLQDLNEGISQIQSGLDALNAQSDTLTEGSAQIKSALEQLQSALNSVSVTSESLQELSDASSQIGQGISDLSSGMQNLQGSIGSQSYKSAMAGNGLDLDSLQAGNTLAISSIDSLLSQAGSLASALEAMGIDAGLISGWQSQGVSLASQVKTLLEGSNALIQGSQAYLDAVSQESTSLVSGAASLQSSYESFDTGIQAMTDSLNSLISQMTQLTQAVNTLAEEYETLDAGLNDYTDGVSVIAEGQEQVSDGADTLLDGGGELKSGSASLYAATSRLLNGIVEIYNATGSLRSGTGELNSGVAELLTGISDLYSGTEELNDGAGELKEETDGMDEEISDKVDKLLESISGGGGETASFVSAKNTQVESLQFVIQTPAIETSEETDETETETEGPSVLEKFLNLF